MYTWIFISCDLISLVLQAAGGGIAGGKKAETNATTRDTGTDVMMAGIIWQVVTLSVFGFLIVDYFWKTYRNWHLVPPQGKEIASRKEFKLFATAIFIAYVAIMTRCGYRIVELTGGWSSTIMRNQPSFIGLEGL